tara:strand:+ start:55418 stop:55705 length:288 start_codon:yes stop_codon:yes gene_type:complete
MKKYLITVGSYKTSTYSFEKDMDLNHFTEWAHENAERFDHTTNPIRESESIAIIDIDEQEVMSKAEAFNRLKHYLEELTSNDEPLELLKMLKPEE